MDNLALFFNQYGAALSSLALLIGAFIGYGKLSERTSANTKAIDGLKGDVREIRTELTEVRVQSARTEAKIDMIMVMVEKKA